jgi:hypothetical protein
MTLEVQVRRMAGGGAANCDAERDIDSAGVRGARHGKMQPDGQ